MRCEGVHIYKKAERDRGRRGGKRENKREIRPFCHATKPITAFYIFFIGVENYSNVNGIEKKVISIKH